MEATTNEVTQEVKDDELDNNTQDNEVERDIDDVFDELVEGNTDEPNDSQESEIEEPAEDHEEPEPTQAPDELDTLRKERDDWMHRAKADAGRVSALTRKQNELLQQLQARQAQGSQEPTQPNASVNPDNSGMTDDQWTEFAEEYPEIARAMELKQQQLNAQQRQIQEQLAQVTQTIEPIQRKAEEERINGQYSVLSERHPDWKDVAASAEFKDWISQQPTAIQAYMSSQDAMEASYLLDVYKAMAGKKSQQEQSRQGTARQDRLRSNVGVKSRSGGVSAGVPDDYDAAFDFFASN